MIYLKLISVLLGGLILAGCESKDPMAYLPAASAGYLGINFEMVEQSEGLKRMDEALGNKRGTLGNWDSEKIQKVYMGLSSSGGIIEIDAFGVAIGSPGMAEDMVNAFKRGGAVSRKVSGFDVYTTDSKSFTPVANTGMLFYQDEALLRKMIAVSKGKDTHARTSSEFRFVELNLKTNAAAAAVNATDIWNSLTPSTIQQIEILSKPGADALREMSMISALFNWKEQPVAEINLHVEDSKATVAAEVVNHILTGLRSAPANEVGPVLMQILPHLTISANEHGVGITAKIPEALLERLFMGRKTGAAIPAGTGAPVAE